jgi:hypothetical protein
MNMNAGDLVVLLIILGILVVVGRAFMNPGPRGDEQGPGHTFIRTYRGSAGRASQAFQNYAARLAPRATFGSARSTRKDHGAAALS